MPKSSKPKVVTLRKYVDAHPQGVRQYQIAAKLGISQFQLSNLLHGVPAGPVITERLRKHGIVLDREEAAS
jgi:hypothetical protein